MKIFIQMSLTMSLCNRLGRVRLQRSFATCGTIFHSEKGCGTGTGTGSGTGNKQADIMREKTPLGKLEEQPNVHPAQEKEPLPEHPGGVTDF